MVGSEHFAEYGFDYQIGFQDDTQRIAGTRDTARPAFEAKIRCGSGEQFELRANGVDPAGGRYRSPRRLIDVDAESRGIGGGIDFSCVDGNRA